MKNFVPATPEEYAFDYERKSFFLQGLLGKYPDGITITLEDFYAGYRPRTFIDMTLDDGSVTLHFVEAPEDEKYRDGVLYVGLSDA